MDLMHELEIGCLQKTDLLYGQEELIFLVNRSDKQ